MCNSIEGDKKQIVEITEDAEFYANFINEFELIAQANMKFGVKALQKSEEIPKIILFTN
jgi:hypothetical protein